MSQCPFQGRNPALKIQRPQVVDLSGESRENPSPAGDHNNKPGARRRLNDPTTAREGVKDDGLGDLLPLDGSHTLNCGV